ncbi:MAG: hypothetical protein K8L97_19185 [Anaerolineae bacterium]|nr:hypothetical protein [Anaerolineae bacterium]
MPIIINWDNPEQNIIRLDYVESIQSWDEYDSAVDAAYEWAQAVEGRVDVIHNTGRIPMPSGSAFPHVQRAMRLAPSNVGVSVAIVDNNFVRALLPIILGASMGRKFQFARSLEEARRLVERGRLLKSA